MKRSKQSNIRKKSEYGTTGKNEETIKDDVIVEIILKAAKRMDLESPRRYCVI